MKEKDERRNFSRLTKYQIVINYSLEVTVETEKLRNEIRLFSGYARYAYPFLSSIDFSHPQSDISIFPFGKIKKKRTMKKISQAAIAE